jgi:hypothetical protein
MNMDVLMMRRDIVNISNFLREAPADKIYS